MHDSTQILTAEAALARADPILGRLIAEQSPLAYTPRADNFPSLVRAIVSQQLSVASARAILGRLEKATKLEPSAVANLSDSDTKAIGLSRQKLSYLVDLSQHFVDDPAVYDHLETLTDDEVIGELVRIKGIGEWTAQMFCIFTLGRLDVFAPDDIGLQRAIKRVYHLDPLPPRKDLAAWAKRWQPYRSVASLHLWQSLHNTPL